MMMRSAPASAVVAIESAKAMRLIAHGIDRHEAQRLAILGHGVDGAADEAARRKAVEEADHCQRDQERHEHPERYGNIAEMDARPDIARRHRSVVDTEAENERDFADEQQAEEKSDAAEALLAAPLERPVIDLVDRGAEREEDRQGDDAGHDRVDTERGVGDIGDERAEDDEGRMRQIGDVEHAKRDRDADTHRGVETAQQQPGDDGVDQQLERDAHAAP